MIFRENKSKIINTKFKSFVEKFLEKILRVIYKLLKFETESGYIKDDFTQNFD